jgi:cytochrome c oxidase subunit 4
MMLEQVKTIITKIKVGGVEHRGVAHVMPIWLLLAVFFLLMFLTWLTVSATYLDLGRLNLFIALLIATIKAFLVALYFMHLRYDRPLHGIIFLFSIIFVMLFVGFVLMDSAAYGPQMIEGYAPEIHGE